MNADLILDAFEKIDDKYIIDAVSEIQAYKQCGNSVVVPLITAVAGKITESLLNYHLDE